MNVTFKVVSTAFLIILIDSSATLSFAQEIAVFNYDDKKSIEDYQSMQLDDSHPNLLDPSVAKDQINEIIGSWQEFHQQVGNFLAKKKFDWETSDSTISIVHKIYFNPDGNITAYFFRVLNDDVNYTKTEEFAALLKEFAKSNRISLARKTKFAQCGKTRYINK